MARDRRPTNIEKMAAVEVPELTNVIRKSIIDRQIRTWRTEQYNLEISMKVAKKIGDDERRIGQLRERMERAERAIMALEEELEEVGDDED